MPRILTAVRRFRWQQWLIVAAFVISIAFSGWQISRALSHFAYMRQHREPPIAGWMTVSHVARAYHVSPRVLEDALALPPGQRDRRPLEVIARSRGQSMPQLEALLLSAIRSARAAESPPPPGGSP